MTMNIAINEGSMVLDWRAINKVASHHSDEREVGPWTLIVSKWRATWRDGDKNMPTVMVLGGICPTCLGGQLLLYLGFLAGGISFVQWSPLWTYLATLHRHEPNNPRDTHRVVLNIFYVKTGELMQDFEGKGNKFAPGFSSVAGPSWPVFRLVQIPSKEELRQKNLYSVSDVKMFWQNNGEYLAVKVDRYTKTKKSTTTGFELFQIKERHIPIEILELENKNDKIVAFAWEPKGHRFAIIHGDGAKPEIKAGKCPLLVTCWPLNCI
ncbi:hypothetical protein HPP92_005388 [Vanilla planifolia]|uniref:Translation initiation factor beta propellor-like domain-containing protein n=1 Tax=Vanilla planifolia TaxID=51239 RepID=A0A835RGQ0_VANPL|nr:hypothetical protein HPP92_005388 [Vanilla planifolia]